MISPAIRLCSNRVRQHVIEDVRVFGRHFSTVTNLELNKNRNGSASDEQLLKFKNAQRCLSTVPANVPAVFESDEEKLRDFMGVFPEVVREVANADRYPDVPAVAEWLGDVLRYNVPGGKRNCAVELALAYRLLERPDRLTAQATRLAYVLGWCCELLKARFAVAEDVIVSAERRRGAPCWHRVPGVGLAAVNDAIMLEQAVYVLLRRHLGARDTRYVHVLELFHEMTAKASAGLRLDLSGRGGAGGGLGPFTMERYRAIAEYRSGCCMFRLPVGAAMHLARVHEPEYHRQARHVLLELGHVLQVRRDYLDCYGDAALVARDTSDIAEGRCTWLAVVALQRATPAQRALLDECYGRRDPARVQRVKELYEELGLPNTYAVYTEKTYCLIRTHIQQMSARLPHNLFFTILEMVYGKDKCQPE